MTTAHRDDVKETQRVLNLPNVSPTDNTWLRHRANTQAAVIDVMILRGKFTIEEIAIALNARETKKQPLKKRILRVADHIAHLQEGNARGRWSGMKSHRLKINTDSKGRLSFDV